MPEKLILYPIFPKKYGSIGTLRKKFLDGLTFEDKNDRKYTVNDIKDGETVLLVSRVPHVQIEITLSVHHRLPARILARETAKGTQLEE